MLLNLSIDTDAQVRPRASRAPGLDRRSFLRYTCPFRVSLLAERRQMARGFPG
jgi:hypothetical protein